MTPIERNRARKALATAKAMCKARQALNAYIQVCIADGEKIDMDDRRDGRIRLSDDLREYEGFLESKYGGLLT